MDSRRNAPPAPDSDASTARRAGLLAGGGILGYGYSLVFRRPRTACRDGTCATAAPGRWVNAALWLATLPVAAATAFPRLLDS